MSKNITEEAIRQQTKEFKNEIERRFARSRHNHIYAFPYENPNASNDDSLGSLEHTVVYELSAQNKTRKTASTSKGIGSVVRTNYSQENKKCTSISQERNTAKTSSILLKLLCRNKIGKDTNYYSRFTQQQQQKTSFHVDTTKVLNRTSTARSNASFYQANQSYRQLQDSRPQSKNATSRIRTEGSVLRETTNIISPKVIKSPTYSKYIQVDSYLNSAKNQSLRAGILTNKNKKSFEFSKLNNFSMGN